MAHLPIASMACDSSSLVSIAVTCSFFLSFDLPDELKAPEPLLLFLSFVEDVESADELSDCAFTKFVCEDKDVGVPLFSILQKKNVEKSLQANKITKIHRDKSDLIKITKI